MGNEGARRVQRRPTRRASAHRAIPRARHQIGVARAHDRNADGNVSRPRRRPARARRTHRARNCRAHRRGRLVQRFARLHAHHRHRAGTGDPTAQRLLRCNRLGHSRAWRRRAQADRRRHACNLHGGRPRALIRRGIISGNRRARVRRRIERAPRGRRQTENSYVSRLARRRSLLWQCRQPRAAGLYRHWAGGERGEPHCSDVPFGRSARSDVVGLCRCRRHQPPSGFGGTLRAARRRTPAGAVYARSRRVSGLDRGGAGRECGHKTETGMYRMIAAAAMVMALGAHAAAQDWPTRPITLIVPFAAGGGIDVSARIQAQRMGELLGQSIVIENVGAAAGMAGGVRVAKAPPDGYTLLIGNTGTHAFNQSLYKKPLYNAATDFEPVGLVSESPRILIARKDLPADKLPQFIAYLKANEKTAQFGSAGVGSGTHLPCVLLNLAIGVNPTHVPYRGEGPVTQDLIGGRIDYLCSTIQNGAAQANQGAVKAIAVMAEKRVPIIPGVATTGEQGLPGVEASVWNAFFFPKGTPEPIVRKLNKAMSDTLDDPAIRRRLEELGLEIVAPERRTPEYLAKYLPAEIERWAKPMHAAGISAD